MNQALLLPDVDQEPKSTEQKWKVETKILTLAPVTQGKSKRNTPFSLRTGTIPSQSLYLHKKGRVTKSKEKMLDRNTWQKMLHKDMYKVLSRIK